jgi:hypothetical protein
MPPPLVHKIRPGFLCGGVDVCTWTGGWLSCVHGVSDIIRTADALASLLNLLRQDGEFS